MRRLICKVVRQRVSSNDLISLHELCHLSDCYNWFSVNHYHTFCKPGVLLEQARRDFHYLINLIIELGIPYKQRFTNINPEGEYFLKITKSDLEKYTHYEEEIDDNNKPLVVKFLEQQAKYEWVGVKELGDRLNGGYINKFCSLQRAVKHLEQLGFITESRKITRTNLDFYLSKAGGKPVKQYRVVL